MTHQRLTILEEQGKYVLCRCECGRQRRALKSNVRSNKTRSCGCLQKEKTKEANTKHGWRHTQLYVVWKAMKARCYNPRHDSYPWYGGKGITVCEEWKNNFTRFALDMGADYEPGLTIDRIDSTKEYCKSNCQWLTKSENSAKGGSSPYGEAL